MRNHNRTTRMALVAFALSLPLGMAACGSNDTTSSSSPGSSSSMSESPMSSSPMTESPMASGSAMADGKPFGAGCSAVPADGKGSFAGMAMDPVATAAGNNPVLSTLVKAVGDAGLADTLNTTQDITVPLPETGFHSTASDRQDAQTGAGG